MKPLFTQDMLDFMIKIRFNNNKEFIHSHRQEYERRMRQPYYDLIERMAPAMLTIDPEMEVRPAKVLSRIFRDTRYSRNKAPYRDHHWIAFRRQGEPRDLSVMYWFEIRVEAVSWGLGFWGENRPAMENLRMRMLAKPADFLEVIDISKANQFSISGAAYQRKAIPEGLHPALHQLYIMKDIYFVKQGIEPAVVFNPHIAELLSKDFVALKPAYWLLRNSRPSSDTF